MGTSVLLESGERAVIAAVDGDNCVVQSGQLSFMKPRWVEDKTALSCLLCKNKFTTLRRKHHCRSCGRVFCNTCCSEKLILSHIGYTDEERICSICKPVATLLYKSHSSQDKSKVEAARGFYSFIQAQQNMQEILELGGLQTLIWLCNTHSTEVLQPLVSSLHLLSTQSSLLPYLLEAGLIKAITSILSKTNSDDQLATDCISIVLILSKQNQYVHTVVHEGGLRVLLEHLIRVDDLSRLLILQTVMLLSPDHNSPQIIMNDIGAIRYMISLTLNFSDVQVATLIYKILANVSASCNSYQLVSLSQEEKTATPYLSKNIEPTHNQELLISLTCLIANVASEQDSQLSLGLVVQKLHLLLDDPNTKYFTHVLRAVSNVTSFSTHAHKLVTLIQPVHKLLELPPSDERKMLSLKILLSLLRFDPQRTSEQISRCNSESFLRVLGQSENLMKTISEYTSTLCKSTAHP